MSIQNYCWRRKPPDENPGAFYTTPESLFKTFFRCLGGERKFWHLISFILSLGRHFQINQNFTIIYALKDLLVKIDPKSI